MPNKNTDPEAALQKLGQRLRAGMAVQHPEPNLDAVRGAVREQYEQEQTAKRGAKAAPDARKGRHQQPPEPEPER